MKKTKHIKETLCSIKRMNFCSSKKSMLTYIYDMLDVDSEKRSFLELEVDSLSASAFGRKFIMAVSKGTSCGVRCGGSLASFRAANVHTYIHIYMVIDLKVLVRSFNCESRACYVGNPRESFFSSSRK